MRKPRKPRAPRAPRGTRSRTTLNNLQQVSDNGGNVRKGLAQYFTPQDISKRLYQRLLKRYGRNPADVIDPQCGNGALISAFPFSVARYGIDIDKVPMVGGNFTRVTGDCRAVESLIRDLYADDMYWECGVANYPFGLPWSPANWTFNWLLKRTSYGYIIGSVNELEPYSDHPAVWDREVFDWPDANVQVMVLFYESNRHTGRDHSDLRTRKTGSQWSSVYKIMDEEQRRLPEFNVWLNETSKIKGRQGVMNVYLSTRKKVKHNISHAEARMLINLTGSTPQTLAVDRETRVLLKRLVSAGYYKIQPEAEQAINEAIVEAEKAATPIMPVTDFERVAYLDEEDHILCIKDYKNLFKKGKRYDIRTLNYTFQQNFTRRKPVFDGESGLVATREHHVTLSGQDRKIRINTESPNGYMDFMSNPDPNQATEMDESLLWEIFNRPPVLTIADKRPEDVADMRQRLEWLEAISCFRFFPGQLEYLSRVLVKDSALIAADVGTGKSLYAISAYAVKGAKRCLIVCPKGTVDSGGNNEDELSQWVSEISRFAPQCEVFEMFSEDDYRRIKSLNGGKLPDGFYVTYYDAFFSNGAMEMCKAMAGGAPQWTDDELMDIVYPNRPIYKPSYSCVNTESIGQSNGDGIRCIAKPSLSTLIGHEFDMVCLDEAHNIKGMDAKRTQAVIRLSPEFRYAFTATPVPNTVQDIFSIMGWVCVKDWYKGGIASAAFPYRVEDEARFVAAFLSKERDHTAEDLYTRKTMKNRKVEKVSPVISSPARLLKILKPSIAYITKKACNPDYLPPRVVDIRVPMGNKQNILYGFLTNRSNITATISGKAITGKRSIGLVQASAQIEWLRSACTDPRETYNKAMACLNTEKAPHLQLRRMNLVDFSPKVGAIMDLVADCLKAGEQVVIVNSRKGITDTLHDYLEEAGVGVSRIDSSNRSGNHSEESNIFKRKFTKVMLMGIKCAVGHSFDQCNNLIVGSLEYAPGPFDQAKGRVDRLTSKESKIYCILNKNSIEEVMFDTVALKDDASKIVLRGQRVPRDFQPVDMSEVLLDSIIAWNNQGEENVVDEDLCAELWPAVKEKILRAVTE